jgi:hypothetical protein
MLDPNEKKYFMFNIMLFATVWAVAILLYLNVPFNQLEGLPRLLSFFAIPLIAPFTALILVIYCSEWIAKITRNPLWLMRNSFWPRQIFIVLPIVNAVGLLQFNGFI